MHLTENGKRERARDTINESKVVPGSLVDNYSGGHHFGPLKELRCVGVCIEGRSVCKTLTPTSIDRSTS